MSLDVIRYQAEPASIIDNDAQACYDRNLLTLLCYALIRLGLPIHLVRFMTNWLTNARYRLKLHGRLTASYTSTPEHPLQGTGQGTGWSPPNWLSMSDLITRTMDAHTPRIKLVHPNGTQVQKTIEAFVDDTNSGLTTDALQTFEPHPLSPVPKLDTIYS